MWLRVEYRSTPVSSHVALLIRIVSCRLLTCSRDLVTIVTLCFDSSAACRPSFDQTTYFTPDTASSARFFFCCMSYNTTFVAVSKRRQPVPPYVMSVVPAGGLIVLVVELLKSLMSICWLAWVKTANRLRATNTAELPGPRLESTGSTAPEASRGKFMSSYVPPSDVEVTNIALSAGLYAIARGGVHGDPSFFRDSIDGDSRFFVKS